MIGRFLIVVTFLEDALRILTQWNDQLLYLRDYRHSKLLLLTSWRECEMRRAQLTKSIT